MKFTRTFYYDPKIFPVEPRVHVYGWFACHPKCFRLPPVVRTLPVENRGSILFTNNCFRRMAERADRRRQIQRIAKTGRYVYWHQLADRENDGPADQSVAGESLRGDNRCRYFEFHSKRLSVARTQRLQCTYPTFVRI